MPKLPGVFLILTVLSNAVYAQRTTISDEEALQTGHFIDSVTSSGSAAALNNFIDFDSLLGNVQKFAVSFPHAPSSYLMMIDLYNLKKDYAKGLIAVDKLDSIVGKDPFLDMYRGNFYKRSGNRDESLSYYERLYRTDPTLAINTRTLITTYAQAGRYDDAKRVIGEYKQTAGFRQEDLDKLYSNFPSLK